MRVLILGGDGMLGHRLLAELEPVHEVAVTLRRPFEAYSALGLFNPARSFCNIDACAFETVVATLDAFGPQVVINAIGLVKQRDDADQRPLALAINAMLPHRLAEICKTRGAHLIHISTDCVFSGHRGFYNEDDIADAEDVYGRTKFLGEVSAAPCVTLRTSIIGRELSRKRGLLEWLLAQKGAVRGYTRAIFSGLTTHELSRVIRRLIENYPQVSGLYHVASEPIAKHDLIQLIKRALDLQIEVVPDDCVVVDRSLDGGRFNEAFGYRAPSWETMVADYSVQKKGNHNI